MFSEGRWLQLLINSEACAAAPLQLRHRNQTDTTERQVERPQSLVLMDEVPSGQTSREIGRPPPPCEGDVQRKAG